MTDAVPVAKKARLDPPSDKEHSDKLDTTHDSPIVDRYSSPTADLDLRSKDGEVFKVDSKMLAADCTFIADLTSLPPSGSNDPDTTLTATHRGQIDIPARATVIIKMLDYITVPAKFRDDLTPSLNAETALEMYAAADFLGFTEMLAFAKGELARHMTSVQCMSWAAEHQNDELLLTSALNKVPFRNEKSTAQQRMRAFQSLPKAYLAALLAMTADSAGFTSWSLTQPRAYKEFLRLLEMGTEEKKAPGKSA